MIQFIAGIATGAVMAFIAVKYVGSTNTNREEKQEMSAEQERLNAEKLERRRHLEKLEEQFNNMMEYTGKEQRKA